MENLKKLGKDRKYDYKQRVALAVAFAVIFVVGVASDPQGFWESVVRFPTAFATMVTWLILTFALVWFLLDMAMKWLLEKSLRSLIEEADPAFQRMFVVAMIIAIPIMILAAR